MKPDHVDHTPQSRVPWHDSTVSRRSVLVGAGVFTAVVVQQNPLAALANSGAIQQGQSDEWNGARSANGWPIIDPAQEHRIEGSNASIQLAGGAAALILLHVARRLSYEIEEIESDDAQGHRTDRAVEADFESNYLSGTAFTYFDIRYPIRAEGGFFASEELIIRDILADCEGTVRWGGDLTPSKGSHFQIDVRPTDPHLAAVAAKFGAWDRHMGRGAGAIDPLAPGRRRAAEVLERSQTADAE